MKKCIMIQTPDQKKLFTYEENLPSIKEFSKLFNAKVSLVEVAEASSILNLDALAPALCERQNQKISYRHIRAKVSRDKKTVSKVAQKIRKYIKIKLMQGEIISLKTLTKRYRRYNLTTACLCNHFKQTRSELAQLGYQFKKIGGGKYRIE